MSIIITSTTRTAEEMAETFGLAEPEPTPAPSDTPEATIDAPTDEAPKAPATVSVEELPPTPAPDEPRRVSRAQQRINDVLRDKKIAELDRDKARQEREQLAAEVARLTAQPPVKVEPPAPAAPIEAPVTSDDPEPKEDNFEDWQSYQRALSRWDGRQEARRIIGEAEAKQAAEAQRVRQQAELVTQAQTYNANAQEARARHADFDEMVNKDIPIAPAMSGVMIRSTVGPDLAYHFGTHPEEAARIRALPTNDMLTEMFRLEGRLLAMREMQTTATPPAARPSSAPRPPAMLPATGGVSSIPTTRTARTYAEFKVAEARERAAKEARG